MARALPPHLISITAFASEALLDRTTAHRRASQGKLGPIIRLPGSNVAYLDRRELVRIGCLKPSPEPLPPAPDAGQVALLCDAISLVWVRHLISQAAQSNNPAVAAALRGMPAPELPTPDAPELSSQRLFTARQVEGLLAESEAKIRQDYLLWIHNPKERLSRPHGPQPRHAKGIRP